MTKSATTNAQLKELELIHNYLEDDGWSVAMLPPDQENPYHRVTADIVSEADHDQLLWKIELSLLPIPETKLPHVNILQCFIPIADQFTTLLKPGLFEMLTKINTKLPFVGFGFIDEFNLLYFKHNQMIPREFTDTNGIIISETLGIIVDLISTFTEPIVHVATGQRDIKTALTEMKYNKIFE